MTPDIPANQGEEVVLANPRGFCAGVDRAIQIVERALEAEQPMEIEAEAGKDRQLNREPESC